ncbi:MAG: EF-P beta-lysylation protein EpmB, partial [Gammaproteobacteria bacterium]|nr:EF-P beta-lysylation protein EpmB [Gammaproteobacteria bacterium]
MGQDRGCIANPDFPVRVPRPYIARMRRGDADDPLLRQVLPSPLEDESARGFSDDALAEADAMVDTGLMQKYSGRALLIA